MRGVLTLLLVICFISLGALWFSERCNATTIYVDDSGGTDYTSIQDAIDAANTSDIIYVYSGVYQENLVINKSITLQGEGGDSTEIHGSGDHTIKILASNVSISGFTVKNTGISNSFSSVYLDCVSNCFLENLVIQNAGNGIYLVNSNGNTVMNNYIHSSNIGIYLSNADENIVKDNDIKNNNAYGIYITSTSNGNILYLNDFSDNILGNAYDRGENSWSYQSKGNYWSDYNGYDKDKNGIGDTPYLIDDDSIDYYPLGYFLPYDEQPMAYIDSITPNPATEGDEIQFNGHGVDDGTILEWEWYSSKDGLLSKSEDFSTTKLSTGTHIITFRVKDDQDQWSEYAEETLVVQPRKTVENQPPIAEIVTVNPREAPIGNTIYFHGYGVDNDGYIVAYSWRSSIDGIISTSPTFSTSNLSVGYHIIYFKVKDNEGSWSKEDIIDVRITELSSSQNTPPVPDPGGPYTGMVNESIFFNASKSFDPDGAPLISYQWDFGDGVTGEGRVTTHTYTTPGNYTIRLTVRDEEGLEDTAVTYIN
ncbi:MAG TPA: PKD domain-containing protein, partial [Thermoplasmatales archaeon]|nr:PKD domain-containing protein [Thermoplasmatales archaeon]